MPAKLNAKALLMGAIVGDCSSVNCHWIYPKLFEAGYQAFVKDVDGKPEFCKNIYNPFYRGQPSPYGDQVIALMDSLVECGGWDKQNFKKKLYQTFGPNTRYQNKTPVENPIAGKPVQGGHSNHSTKYFVQHYEEHGEFANNAEPGDRQADSYIKAAVLAAYYLGKPEYFDIVKECVEVSQDAEDATNTSLATAEFYEAIFNTSGELTAESVRAFVNKKSNQEHVSEDIQKKFDELEQSWDHSLFDYSQATGVNCRVPAAFLVSLHALYNALKNFSDPQDVFMNAIRSNTMVGGCNCSRNIIIGSIVAGMHGMEAIPTSWIEKTEPAKHFQEAFTKMNFD